MIFKFKQWGSSIGMVIPKSVVNKYNIELGKEYEIIGNEDSFSIIEVNAEPSLDELLANMNRKSRYDSSELVQGATGKEKFWEE